MQHGPLAYAAPSGQEIGLYLGDARFATGYGPLQTEIMTIEGFDALVDEHRISFVMFGYYGYPRRAVVDLAKARRLVEKLLRQYARGEWGRFRQEAK